MNYYKPGTLVTLEGDQELIGVWPAIAKIVAKVGSFAVGGISKAVRRKRKRRAQAKKKAERERQKREQLRIYAMRQQAMAAQEKKRKQGQLMTLAIPAMATIALLGKDSKK